MKRDGVREEKCEYLVRGQGGVKGKEYGTKEVRQAKQRGVRCAIRSGGLGSWKEMGEWHGNIQLLERNKGAREIRSQCWVEQRCANT